MFKKMKTAAIAVSMCSVLGMGSAQAALSDIALGAGLGQTTFNNVVEDMGMIVAYNPVAPAEPYGITGFDAGVAMTFFKIDTTEWVDVMPGAPSTIPVPKMMVRKGLPMNIDVGASYVKVPSTNITIIGGEVRYAILDGGMATPAVSVSGHLSRLSGVDDLDISTYGVDIGVSKGFLMFTPYAGVGLVNVKGSENSALVTLADHSATLQRSYVGLKFGFLPFVNLVAQVDFGAMTSYTARLNIGF